jgi:hypothetical protein
MPATRASRMNAWTPPRSRASSKRLPTLAPAGSSSSAGVHRPVDRLLPCQPPESANLYNLPVDGLEVCSAPDRRRPPLLQHLLVLDVLNGAEMIDLAYRHTVDFVADKDVLYAAAHFFLSALIIQLPYSSAKTISSPFSIRSIKS